MIEPTTLDLSGDRLVATYDFHGDPSEADERVRALCVEQTIEFPADLVPDDDIQNEIIGRVESKERLEDDLVRVSVSYAVETTGFELPQLLNVLFGNSSLLRGVKLVDVSLPPTVRKALGRPRFGVKGLRTLFDAPSRPLLATALKPMGSSPERLASFAYELAAGGMDMIKDDHSLGNQPFAEFRERVLACSEAVAKANAETGNRAIYMPSINAPHHALDQRARFAVEAGAGGLLVLPGLTGFDHMRALSADEAINVPIMGHPAFLGGYVSSPTGGIDHGVLFGSLFRYAGADTTIFPNHGGRFSFSEAACLRIAEKALEPIDGLPRIFPTPGGGMVRSRVAEMIDFYGRDVVLLIGGDLHRDGSLRENAAAFRAAVA